jgi:GWxTD domain-containing protein
MNLRTATFLTLLLAALAGHADERAEIDTWGAGPAQWIMTADEKRAWRRATTESARRQFIDLFWARRDPTPGTFRNEFRREFEARVAVADEQFAEKERRGALTERGRVYVVLGPSTNFARFARQENAARVVSDRNSVTRPSKTNREGFDTRQRAAIDLWVWEYADARQFDMGRVEVAFIEDPVTLRVQRDPRRGDFSRAESVAIRKAIVSPGLTAAPEWATKPPADLPAQPPATRPGVAGASSLVLQRGASYDPSSDPFASAETTFSTSDEVRWAVQLCPSGAAAPQVTTMLRLRGPLDGTAAEAVTRPKETKLEELASSDCYVARGMVPIASLGKGRFALAVVIEDVATHESWTVNGEFRLE